MAAKDLVPEYERDRIVHIRIDKKLIVQKRDIHQDGNNKLVPTDANAPEPRHKIFLVSGNRTHLCNREIFSACLASLGVLAAEG